MDPFETCCAVTGLPIFCGSQCVLALVVGTEGGFVPAALPLEGRYDGQGGLLQIEDDRVARSILAAMVQWCARGQVSTPPLADFTSDALEWVIEAISRGQRAARAGTDSWVRVDGAPLGFVLVLSEFYRWISRGHPTVAPALADTPIARSFAVAEGLELDEQSLARDRAAYARIAEECGWDPLAPELGRYGPEQTAAKLDAAREQWPDAYPLFDSYAACLVERRTHATLDGTPLADDGDEPSRDPQLALDPMADRPGAAGTRWYTDTFGVEDRALWDDLLELERELILDGRFLWEKGVTREQLDELSREVFGGEPVPAALVMLLRWRNGTSTGERQIGPALSPDGEDDPQLLSSEQIIDGCAAILRDLGAKEFVPVFSTMRQMPEFGCFGIVRGDAECAIVRLDFHDAETELGIEVTLTPTGERLRDWPAARARELARFRREDRWARQLSVTFEADDPAELSTTEAALREAPVGTGLYTVERDRRGNPRMTAVVKLDADVWGRGVSHQVVSRPPSIRHALIALEYKLRTRSTKAVVRSDAQIASMVRGWESPIRFRARVGSRTALR